MNNSIADFAAKFINNTNKNVFLTGKAGTGKTTFLKYIIRHTFKNAVIVAPTGIAAMNAGGVTIHSMFQLPFGSFIPSNQLEPDPNASSRINTPNSLLHNFQMNNVKRKVIQEMELLIIDEVSMLRADVLDAIDQVLRNVRKRKNVPFGGVQVLFIGDMWMHLKKYYTSAFFFEALVLKESSLLYLELDKIYRQIDDTFINLLNNLRNNKVTAEDIALLNEYYKPDFIAPDSYIQLTTHNYKADIINKEALQKLNAKSRFYAAEIKGHFNESAYPVEVNMELKVGAQVMFIKNDTSQDKKFYNGKIGRVVTLDDENIRVCFDDEKKTIDVTLYEWQNIKYSVDKISSQIEENVVGSFFQYPIKLAWAITVHKSQGLTFTKAVIDIGKAFAPGQVYVALSRLTSLKGLVLSSPINYNSLKEDTNIAAFATTKTEVNTLAAVLEEASHLFYREYIMRCFNFSELEQKLKNHLKSYSKVENKSAPQQHLNWAMKLKEEFDNEKTNADKFLTQLNQIIDPSNTKYKSVLQERIAKASAYFTPVLKHFSKKIATHSSSLMGEKKTKQYHEELQELDAEFYKQLQAISKAEAFIKTVVNNNELNREHIHSNHLDKERAEEIKSKPVLPKKKKPVKGDSQELTYHLYKEGKSIPEIVLERGLTTSTIESHLAHYAGIGLLDVFKFISKTKYNAIIKIADSLEKPFASSIRNILGDEYSFSEIRFALGYYQNANKNKIIT
ncbi:MAG: helix-turn-helix domain-containing protein [Bacteroidetes bacterium]|nr:helix-turn-helix domain-containing protein [Bacteroidota bacterium]